MKIRHKLMILAAIPNLGLAFLGWQAFSERTHDVAEMHTLESLTLLAADISSMIHEVETERGLSAAYLSSDGERFGPELTEQHRATDQRERTLRETLGTINAAGFPPTFSTTLAHAADRISKLDYLRRSVLEKDIQSAVAISKYTGIIDDLMGVIALISTRGSDARLSAQLHAYDLFMRGKDHAGSERAILADAFSKDSFGDGEYQWFVAMVAEQTAHFEGFLALADPELASAFLSISETNAAVKVDQYRQIAHEHAATGGFSASAADWFRAAGERTQILRELDKVILEKITSITHAAHSRAEASRTSLGVVVAALIIGSVAISLTIGRFIARPIGTLVERIQEIAEGDLTKRVEVTGADELGELGRCFNAFVENFHGIMTRVSDATREVASAATEIATSSEQMAAGLADQQEQRVQISAAVEQMLATVTDVAGRSADAASAAESSGREAADGGRVVAETVEEMNGISAQVSEASLAVAKLGQEGEQIGEIIGVINDIADQTNLLALNAAIEAARAGEHGRGFAVVADEVRKLAERTTNATQEVAQSIRQIRNETATTIEQIEAGTSRVSRGVELAHGAGEALARIVQASRSVQSMVQSIAAASEEQSTSTQQIAKSMAQIDMVTRESTEGARQASGAAAQMSLLADSLRTLIARFTIEPTANA